MKTPGHFSAAINSHTRAPILDRDAAGANYVVQALTHLSRDMIDDNAVQRLAAQVDDADMKLLTAARPRMPGWMSDIILKISAARNG